MLRRHLLLLAVVTSVLVSGFSTSASTTLTLGRQHLADNPISWDGTVTRPATSRSECATVAGTPLDCTSGAVPSGTDSQTYVASLGSARRARVTTWVQWPGSDSLAVWILDDQGNVVRSRSGNGSAILSYTVLNHKRYEVRVVGSVNANTQYTAYTFIRRLEGQNYNGPGKLKYPTKDIFATVDIPINVVFVGFDDAEVQANKQRVLDQMPEAFRPVIRIGGSRTGGDGLVQREGGPQARRLSGLSGSQIEIEPIEYRYKPRIVTASEDYSKKFFAAAKAATQEGDYQLPYDREFIERYNARAAALRGINQVSPNSPIDFVDGISLEDWVAKNPPAADISFDLSKPASGYTYFVVDSYRPAYAGEFFNLSRYHNFRVMNETTLDPDSGTQNGFDWGRVWGGRYRFLMLDTGAAPNAWEAAHYPTTKIFRVSGNGDSSITDPPVWHYNTATIGDFYDKVGEDVQFALWMRFTRGYLYRPKAYEKFILAGNTWHDADAYVPWPSKLEDLYKDQLILKNYAELIPYAEWKGFSNFKYLSKGDPEQDAIDDGKRRSINGAPVPFAVSTDPVMSLINRNRDTYAPLEVGAFTVPVLNVVFQSLHTFSLPAIVGGIAAGEDGEPWGQIQNVNDRTKTPTATTTVKDSSGTERAPLGPDVRESLLNTVPGGVDNVARFGFTSTAFHEAGHFFGLSHTHDAVAYDPAIDSDASSPTGYYDTIDWMYTTTASPMGYGWQYNKFEVLDKDNIWIGHTLEWLKEAQEAIADSYAAFDVRRRTKLTAAVDWRARTAESYMNASVKALKEGRYLDAVTAAKSAMRWGYWTLNMAAWTVVPGYRDAVKANATATAASAAIMPAAVMRTRRRRLAA
ncbi:MAG TPA: hypothetical protein VM841_01665 [Actinomycetota bacterium]|nr:hypothetical protein [Actinomycetota bacterium]